MNQAPSEAYLRSLAEWSPPLLSQSPATFWDGEDLWICYNDTRRSFGLNDDEMAKLPLVDDNALPRRERFWLYHVWDLARVLKGEGAAGRGLVESLTRYRGRMQAVWDKMGLGPLN